MTGCCSVGDMVLLSAVAPTSKRHQPTRYTVNPHHVLQVRQDATVSEIRQNYRRLALWHHPGRPCKHVDEQELERRAVVFEVLAACYETLVYYRNEYNLCLNSLDHVPLKGEVHVGGKRMTILSFDEDYEVVPTLSKASSGIISNEAEQELMSIHEEIDRGPMELMYKARHYKPFVDPYDIFEQVFGRAVFPRPKRQPNTWLVVDESLTATPAPIWTGSRIKKRDGTIVSYTCRTFQNIKVTKTETTFVDSKRRPHGHVQVTSEQVQGVDDVLTPKAVCRPCPWTPEITSSSCGFRLMFPSE